MKSSRMAHHSNCWDKPPLYFTLFSRRKKERWKRKCVPHENVLTKRMDWPFGSPTSRKVKNPCVSFTVQL